MPGRITVILFVLVVLSADLLAQAKNSGQIKRIGKPGPADLLPARSLESIAKSIVRIRSKDGRRSGIGIVFRRERDEVFIAAARIAIEPGNVPEVGEERGVVYEPGSPREREGTGVIAVSNEADGICIVRAKGERLPPAATISKDKPTPERSPYAVYPAEFGRENQFEGQRLKVLGDNRASKGKDTKTNILVQPANGTFPNSDGSLVVDRDGALMGLIGPSLMRNADRVIPVEEIAAQFAPRARRAEMMDGGERDGQTVLKCRILMDDLLEEVRSAHLLIAPRGEVKATGRPNGPLSNAATHKLEPGDGGVVGEIAVAHAPREPLEYLVQAKIITKSGKTIHSEPRAFSLQPREAADPPPVLPSGFARIATPADVPAALDATLPLPSPIEEVAVAGAGRYVVLKPVGQSILQVYDAFSGTISASIRPGSDFTTFAAGGGRALTYHPSPPRWMLWDITTGERVAEQPGDPLSPVQQVRMGCANDSFAVAYVKVNTVRTPDGGTSSSTRATPRFDRIELPSLVSRKLNIPDKRANYALSIWSFQLDSLSNRMTYLVPTGAYMTWIDGWNGQMYFGSTKVTGGASGDDGRFYAIGGATLDAQGRSLGTLQPLAYYPAIGAGCVLGVSHDGHLMLFEAGQSTLAAPCGDWQLPNWAAVQSTAQAARGLTLAQRVVFAPLLGRLVYLPASNDRIVQKPLDVNQAVARFNGASLVTSIPPPARAGDDWTYQISCQVQKDKPEFVLESGPAGMTVSKEGAVSWSVPGDASIGAQAAVITINGPGDTPVYHRFFVHVFAKDSAGQNPTAPTYSVDFASE